MTTFLAPTAGFGQPRGRPQAPVMGGQTRPLRDMRFGSSDLPGGMTGAGAYGDPTRNQRGGGNGMTGSGAYGDPTRNQRGGGRYGTRPLGGTSTFGADNNLIGSQILPSNSTETDQAQGWTTQSGDAFNTYQFQPFRGVAPLDFGTERGMLTGANDRMGGLSYNFGAANGQYANAQQQQGAAANTATRSLQGLGQGNYSGGGANLANTGELKAGLGRAESTMGGPFTYEGDTGRARALTMNALESAQGGPERSAIAAENMSLLEERSRPGYEQSLRSVTARNAAMGRRGSGITTNELGDVTLARERELALARRDSANDAASRTMGDRIDRTNLAQGVTLGLGSEDRGAAQTRLAQAETQAKLAGMGFDAEKFNAGQSESASQRAASGAQFGANMQRGVANDIYGMGADASNLSMGIGDRFGTQERDRVGLGERQAGFTRDTANDLAGLTRDRYGADVRERDTARADEYGQFDAAGTRFRENQNYLSGRENSDYNRRQETRGERAYQYGLSRDSIDDDYRRQGWEETLRNGRYSRALGTANVGFGANSPSGAYRDAADQAGGQAQDSWGAISDWMQQYGQRRGGAGRGTGTVPPPTGTTDSRPTWG